jgi:DNA-directed RNA polymerase alpha subunit
MKFKITIETDDQSIINKFTNSICNNIELVVINPLNEVDENLKKYLMSIFDLNLTPRSTNALNNAGYFLAVDLLIVKNIREPYDLLRINNIGRHSLNEINSRLNYFNMYIGITYPNWNGIEFMKLRLKRLNELKRKEDIKRHGIDKINLNILNQKIFELETKIFAY